MKKLDFILIGFLMFLFVLAGTAQEIIWLENFTDDATEMNMPPQVTSSTGAELWTTEYPGERPDTYRFQCIDFNWQIDGNYFNGWNCINDGAKWYSDTIDISGKAVVAKLWWYSQKGPDPPEWDDTEDYIKAYYILDKDSTERLFENGGEHYGPIGDANFTIDSAITNVIDSATYIQLVVHIHHNAVEANRNYGFDNVTLESVSTVGIKDIRTDLGINMYPNPAQGEVTLELSSSPQGDVELAVLDITGKVVLSKSYKATDRINLDMSGKVAGMYYVKVTIEGNNTIEKLILEK